MSVKVSIIVPVYNPGTDIEPGFASFLAQTMPQEELEIIYVDDGSTDDTPAWLARVAAEHLNVTLITIPNSGWPGRPRNVAIEAAKGEFVQFVDQDDRLAPDAMRRMYEMAARNGSDVVLGKVVSDFRPIHHPVFLVDRESCTVDDAPLHGSITPHKMFRTSFLRERGLRFPEGKWLREDQLFMTQAYLAEPKASILASYVCYYYWKRTTGVNNADAGDDFGESVRNLGAVVASVVERTEPGTRRDRFMARFFHAEFLGLTLTAARDLGLPEFLDWWRDGGVAELITEHHSEAVVARLGVLERVLLDLSRRADLGEFHRWCRFVASLRASARLGDFAWTADGAIALTVTGGFTYGPDRRPLTVIGRDGRTLLDPAILAEYGVSGVEADLTGCLAAAELDLRLRRREDRTQWSGDVVLTPGVPASDEPQPLALRGQAGIALEAAGARDRLGEGHWDFYLAVTALGVSREIRLGEHRAGDVAAKPRPALLGAPARPAIPYFTQADASGNLSVDIGRASKRLGDHLDGRPVRRIAGGLVLDALTTPGTAPERVRLVLTTASGRTVVPGTLCPAGGSVVLPVPRRWDAPSGTATLSVHLDGTGRRATVLGEVRVRGGRLDLSGFPDSGLVPAPAEAAAIRAAVRPVGSLPVRVAKRVLPRRLRSRVARLVRK
ncbi:hypothetical protein Afil01_40470 [Actinorhabdospora filicis]|uniref:Glycosyltransferase involved in cell wall biosynthesis n=1 Tax=Actinorhabdospora filicis TaxID=1785913 RepID=A0A9W6SLP3_9ACTN|nr:glycosyltransferase [Actinorhabdospora filicis]GLZ79240.1 hypothetical protein Afil01_40470 [Actinorhabdospora filicis]